MVLNHPLVYSIKYELSQKAALKVMIIFNYPESTEYGTFINQDRRSHTTVSRVEQSPSNLPRME